MSKKLVEMLGVDSTDPDWLAAVDDADVLMDLIKALVDRRRELGLVQQEVAERMETTQSAVSDFERLGGDPKLSTLQRYARAINARLGVRLEERDGMGEWCEIGSGSLSGLWTDPPSIPNVAFITRAPHVTSKQFALSA